MLSVTALLHMPIEHHFAFDMILLNTDNVI